jgi:uncharacterized OB-fold protein
MNAPEVAKILPPDTEVSKPFWEGCREGKLQLQHCGECGKYQFYPRIVCSHCGAATLSWKAASGRGIIASFTVVRRGISEAYTAPYIIALIDLAEGPRMMSSIVNANPDEVYVGASVNVNFESWGGNYVLPVFKIDESSKPQE